MDTLKKLEAESKEYYEKWREAEEKIADEKLKKVHLDFTGKFIRYNNPWGPCVYMYVRSTHEDKLKHNEKYSYRLCGFGFTGEMTGYSDATWLDWDFSKEIYVFSGTADGFKEEISHIKEIEPEEFQKAFDEIVKNMMKHHKLYFDSILFGKNEDLTADI
jgi:hypothetical protein